jgi:hypothetical protein
MRAKFLIGGAVVAAAVVYLIVSSISSSAQYYLTVKEVRDKGQAVTGRNLRVSGFVMGDTIAYNPQASSLPSIVIPVEFTLKVIRQGSLHYFADLANTRPRHCRGAQSRWDLCRQQLAAQGPTRYEDQLHTPTPASQ